MTTREYILAADPVAWNGHGTAMREIKERAGSGDWQPVFYVADDNSIDVLDALRRAYQDGREDRSAEITDPRDLLAHLKREAATEQEMGDDYGDLGTEDEQAHRHWGRAEAYRRMIEHIEHELESR